MSLAADLLRRSAMRNAFALSGLFIIVLALCGVWMVAQIRADVRAEIDVQLRLAHEELSDVTEAELRRWFSENEELAIYSEAYRTETGEVLGAVQGSVFETEGFQTLFTEDLFQQKYLKAFDGLEEDLEELGEQGTPFESDSWRVYVGPWHNGQLIAFEPIGGVEDALRLIPRIVLTVGIALVLTTLLAGALVAHQQQARLDRIRDGIARIGRGDLGHPMAPAHPRDDLDEIMLGIDKAAAELDGSISRLRHFSQNVAHELRTPLARLRATLEDNPNTPEAALERTDDVIRTFDAVQRIARLSHRPDPGTLSPVALRDVATLTEELFAEVAAENGQRLHLVLEQPATIQGDFQLLAQMVSNLVENAIRYAGPDAEITLHIKDLALSVSDTGPGLHDSADMTEPFTRAATEQAHQGTGLGLALVKTIARYHGAELTLTSEQGLTAQIRFPDSARSA